MHDLERAVEQLRMGTVAASAKIEPRFGRVKGSDLIFRRLWFVIPQKPNACVVLIVSISWREGLVILGVDLVSVPRLYFSRVVEYARCTYFC